MIVVISHDDGESFLMMVVVISHDSGGSFLMMMEGHFS
jgi:hypothetical protein